MDTTWRKLYAKTLDNAVVRRFGANALGVLAWMILQADADGSVTFTTRDAAQDLRLSHKTFRTILSALKESGTVAVEGGRWSTVATLVKWRDFQPKGTEVAQKRHGSGTTNNLQESDLNAKSAQKWHGSNTEVAQPTQEPGFPPRTPLYRLREDVCVARTREEHTHTEKKENKYPETPAEVIEGAKSEGIEMTESDARDFLDYNAARGWMLGETPVADWKKLLGKWKKAEKEKAVATKRDKFGPTPFSGDYSTTKKRNAAKNWM